MVTDNNNFEIYSENFEQQIPSCWHLVRFNDVYTVTDYVANGSFASLKEHVHYKHDKDYAILVRYTDFVKKWSRGYVYVNESSFKFLNKSTLFPSDIVISNVGDPGKVFQVPDLGQPMTLGPNSVLVRPHKLIDKTFGAFFFSSSWGQDLFNKITTGTAQRKFNKTGLRSIRVPIAPLNEQKRIVDKIERLFSNLDEGEALLKQVQQQLATYRQSVLKAAVTGELTKDWREANKDHLESGEALLQRILKSRRENWQGRGKYQEPTLPKTALFPEVPEGWFWASLGTIIYNGPTNGVSPREDAKGIKSFKLSATTSGEFLINEQTVKFVDFEPESGSKYWLKAGDILIQRGNTIEYVGTAAIFPGPDNTFIYPDLMMRIRIHDPNLAKWAVLWINSSYVREYFKANATGIAGNMPKINGDTLRGIPIPIPCKSELPILISRLEEINLSISRLNIAANEQAYRSSGLRQSILKEAFSGKLVPQDPNDEPASVLLKRIQAQKETLNKPKTAKRKTKATA